MLLCFACIHTITGDLFFRSRTVPIPWEKSHSPNEFALGIKFFCPFGRLAVQLFLVPTASAKRHPVTSIYAQLALIMLMVDCVSTLGVLLTARLLACSPVCLREHSRPERVESRLWQTCAFISSNRRAKATRWFCMATVFCHLTRGERKDTL